MKFNVLILFILHTENGHVHSYPVENDIKLRMISYWGRLIVCPPGAVFSKVS